MSRHQMQGVSRVRLIVCSDFLDIKLSNRSLNHLQKFYALINKYTVANAENKGDTLQVS